MALPVNPMCLFMANAPDLCAAVDLDAVRHGILRTAAQHPLLLFGTFLVWAVAVRISLARRPARPIRVLPGSPANDVIVVIGGLALYAIFILWLHARWFGVAPLAWDGMA
jgi:uncharacterized membrane protein